MSQTHNSATDDLRRYAEANRPVPQRGKQQVQVAKREESVTRGQLMAAADVYYMVRFSHVTPENLALQLFYASVGSAPQQITQIVPAGGTEVPFLLGVPGQCQQVACW